MMGIKHNRRAKMLARNWVLCGGLALLLAGMWVSAAPLPKGTTAADVQKLSRDMVMANQAYTPERVLWKALWLTVDMPVFPPMWRPGAPDRLTLGEVTNLSGLQVKSAVYEFKTGRGAQIQWLRAGFDKQRAEQQDGSVSTRVFRAMMDQSLPQSVWKVSLGRMAPAILKVAGKGQWVECVVTGAPNDPLILATDDPDNTVRLSEMVCYQPLRRHAFRTEVEVPDSPAWAELSVRGGNLWINGQAVKEAPRGGTYENIGRYFKKGRNTIALMGEWGQYNPSRMLEGKVRCKDGRYVLIRTDSRWKGMYDPPAGWEQPEFNATAWKPAKAAASSATPDNDWHGPLGGIPPYYGAIELDAPEGGHFIFDFGKSLEIPVRVLKGVSTNGYEVQWRLMDGLQLIGEGALAYGCRPDRVAKGTLRLSVPKPGAYDLRVSVVSGGVTNETRLEELAVVGRIEQREVPGNDIRDGLDLELTDEVDCADTNSVYGIVDQTQNGDPTPARIRETTAGKYRESDERDCSWFGFAVKLEHYGEPHFVEVEVPDDAPRNFQVRVVEMPGVPVVNDGYGTIGFGVMGSCGIYTGVQNPLSGTMRPMRFVFFPKVPVTGFIIMNYFPGRRAAAGRIRVYRIRNGLPALKVASPDYRLTGQHYERPSPIPQTFYSGRNGIYFSQNMFKIWHRGFYRDWFNTLENLIKYMRFTGENMIIPGIYMYYPQGGGDPNLDIIEFANYIELMGKMFAANGLTVLPGIEYATNDDSRRWRMPSQKELEAGAPTTKAVHRSGAQFQNWAGTDDTLVPEVEAEFLKVVRKAAELFCRNPGVGGLALQVGTTSFSPVIGDGLEYGYGDNDVGRFERETGVKVPVEAKDPQRFEKRYQWLMANAREQWVEWRIQALYRLNVKVAETVRSVDSNKKAYLFHRYLNTGRYTNSAAAFMREQNSYDPQLYKANRKNMMFGGSFERGAHGIRSAPDEYVKRLACMTDPEMIRIMDEGTGYVVDGFSESPNFSKNWIYFRGWDCGYFAPPERDFLWAFGQVLGEAVPMVMAQTWIDYAAKVGNEQERREFNRALRVLPPGPYETQRGAGFDGNLIVRAGQHRGVRNGYVINPYAWTVNARLQIKAADRIKDLGTGEMFEARGGWVAFPLKAYGIRSLELGRGMVAGAEAKPVPEEAAAVKRVAQAKLQLYGLLDKIDDRRLNAALEYYGIRKTAGELRADIRRMRERAAAGDDLYAAGALHGFIWLRFEMWIKVMAEYLKQFAGLPHEYRVDCGSSNDYVDAQGRTWIGDQNWMNGAWDWGYVEGGQVDRGAALAVEGASVPRIYQTERFGLKGYRFRLPNGRYEVRMHFAETWSGSSGARLFGVSLQGNKVIEKLDIFQEAGGINKALLKTFRADVTNGVLAVDFTPASDSPAINGIEVIRKG